MSAYRFSIDSRLTQLYRDAVPLSGDDAELSCILNPRTGQLELFAIGRDGDVYNIVPGTAPVSLGFRQTWPDSQATSLAVGRDSDGYFVVVVAFRDPGGDESWLRFAREGRSGPRWPGWTVTDLAFGGAQVSGGRFGKLLLGDGGGAMPALFACWEPMSANGSGQWIYSYYYMPQLEETQHPVNIYDMTLAQRQPIPLAWGREPKRGSAFGTYLFDASLGSLGYLSQAPALAFQGRGPQGAYPLALASVDLGRDQATPVFIAGSDNHLRFLDTTHDLTGDVIAEVDASTIGQLAGSARPDGRLELFVLQGTTLLHVAQDPASKTGWSDLVPLHEGVSHFETGRNRDGFTEAFAVTRETSPRLLRLSQDPTTTEWAVEEIDVPAREVKPQAYFAFVSGVALVDDQGAPVVDQPVVITPATDVAEFMANGLAYEADPQAPVTVLTNGLGKVVIVAPTMGFDTPELTVSTTPPSGPPLTQPIVANTAVQDKLYGMTHDQLVGLRTHGPNGVAVLGSNPDPATVDAIVYGMQQFASVGRAPKSRARGFSLQFAPDGLKVVERSAQELASRAATGQPLAAAGAAAEGLLDAALGDVLNWISEAGKAILPPGVTVSDLIDFTLQTMEEGGQEIVKAIDWAVEITVNGAQYAYQATVNTLQQALDAVGAFLRTALQFMKDVGEAAWDYLVDAFADLMDWHDGVYDVKSVFKHVFKAFLDWVPDQIAGLKDRVDASLQDVTSMLTNVAQVTGGLDAGYSRSSLQENAQTEERSPQNTSSRSDLDWMIDALTSPDVSGDVVDLDPALTQQLENLWTAVRDNALPIAQDIIDLVEDTVSAVASQTPLGLAGVAHAAQNELDVINRLRTITFAFIDVLAELVRYLAQQADARIDVPILTDFYEQILAFGDDDTKLSVLDATCLLLAGQAMAAYTASTGKTDSPFSKQDLARLRAARWDDLIRGNGNGHAPARSAAGPAEADDVAAIYSATVSFAGSAFNFIEMGLGLASDIAGTKIGGDAGAKWVTLTRAVARIVMHGVSCPMILKGVPKDTTSAAGRSVVLWFFQGYFWILYLAIPTLFKGFLGKTGGSQSFSFGSQQASADVLDIVNGALETLGGIVSFALAVNVADLETKESTSVGSWFRTIFPKTLQNSFTSLFQTTAVARPFLRKLTPWGRAAVGGIHLLGRGGAGTMAFLRGSYNLAELVPTPNDTFGS